MQHPGHERYPRRPADKHDPGLDLGSVLGYTNALYSVSSPDFTSYYFTRTSDGEATYTGNGVDPAVQYTIEAGDHGTNPAPGVRLGSVTNYHAVAERFAGSNGVFANALIRSGTLTGEVVRAGQSARISAKGAVEITPADKAEISIPSRNGLKVHHPGLPWAALSWSGDGDADYWVEVAFDAKYEQRLLSGLVNSLAEWYRPGRPGTVGLPDAVAREAFTGLLPLA